MDPHHIRNADKLDLADWIRAIWHRRGIITDRGCVTEWLKTQDSSHLERLKASGAPVYSKAELRPAARTA